MNTIIKKDMRTSVLMLSSILVVSLFAMNFQNAVVTVGISEGLATNIYFALQWVSWGATAASIVASFGLSAVAAQAVWAAVKRYGIKKFIKW